MAERWGQKWSGWAPVLLRLIAGIIFAVAGWMKWQDMQAVINGFGASGIPAPTFFAYLVGTIELIGGIALIAGLWTRVAAKLLGIIMIVATLITMNKMGFLAAELPLAMFAICFSLFTTGGGKYSMDK